MKDDFERRVVVFFFGGGGGGGSGREVLGLKKKFVASRYTLQFLFDSTCPSYK